MSTATNPPRSHSSLYQLDECKLETSSQTEADGPSHLRETRPEDSVISLKRESHGAAGDGGSGAGKGTWQWDIRTDTTTWSEQLYWIIGRDSNAGIPSFKEHSCFYTSSSWNQLLGATAALLQTGIPYELKLQMLHVDGTRRLVISRGEAVRDPEGNILQLRGTVADISAPGGQVAIAERELQTKPIPDHKIIGRLLEAQEEENDRTASELRTNICQRVSLLAAWIQDLSLNFPGLSPQAQARIEELWRFSTEILTDLDPVCKQLHPFSLDVLGLGVAIPTLCREFASKHGLSVECSCHDAQGESLDKHLALTFFRVVQEALGNIAKHSRAKNVTVKLSRNSTELVLEVSDDGIGFEQEWAHRSKGLGFVRMKGRLGQMGGSLTICTQPGCGTSIEARAPLKRTVRVLSIM